MSIKWTDNLSVGVEAIDSQHKVWFEKANNLFEAGRKGQAKEYISEMLDFLDEYTKLHFSDEEKYMLEINYPEYDVQKKLHDGFIAELAKLKESFNESGGNVAVIVKANKMVVNWLTNHILQQDKKIGEYAKTL
ncbi:MAG: bacteriohemerythrin [Peptococcia bacterium]